MDTYSKGANFAGSQLTLQPAYIHKVHEQISLGLLAEHCIYMASFDETYDGAETHNDNTENNQ